MKTALVTGSTGFIGSHLVASLLASGWKVRATTRVMPGNTSQNDKNKGSLPVNQAENIFMDDIATYSQWGTTLQDVDVVVHLAGLAHDTHQQKKWSFDDYRSINTLTTETIAREAARAGVKRFVFISTIKVNGESTPPGKPFDALSPPNPYGAYSVSKHEAEIALQQVSKDTRLEVVIIRPPLVYGPGVKGNMDELVRMVTKRRIIPTPGLDAKRSFIYVGNLVDAIKTLMVSDAAAGELFTISDGKDVSTADMIRMIADSINKTHLIIPIPVAILALGGIAGDMAQKLLGRLVLFSSASLEKMQCSLLVDSSKLCKTLGWAPPYSMEYGIREMVNSIQYKWPPDLITPEHRNTLIRPSGHLAKPGLDRAIGAEVTNRTNHISVIIVNFNAGQLLTTCVRSVLQSNSPVEVIVSDNDSTDGSISYLREKLGRDPRLHIRENRANLGFAKANNQALAYAGGDHILFLNPDCIIEPDTIERMERAINSNPEVGMAGCLIKNLDGSEQAGCRRMVPTPWRSFVRVLHLNSLFPNYARFETFVLSHQALPEDNISIEALSGAFMFVRKSALENVGILDEKYFMHCEDLDWCMRFRAAGWKILFVPGVEITHIKGACSHDRPIRVLWYKHKGMIRFYKKFFRHQYPFVVMPLIIGTVWLRFCATVLLLILRRNPRNIEDSNLS